MALEKAKKRLGRKHFSISLKFKTLQAFKISFAYDRESEVSKILDLLLVSQSNPSPSAIYAFHHRPTGTEDHGWTTYQPKQEFARMGIPSEDWRLTNLNSEYSVAPSYPALLAVPYNVPLETLVLASKFRRRGRLPVLTWKVGQLQPTSGPVRPCCYAPLQPAVNWIVSRALQGG